MSTTTEKFRICGNTSEGLSEQTPICFYPLAETKSIQQKKRCQAKLICRTIRWMYILRELYLDFFVFSLNVHLLRPTRPLWPLFGCGCMPGTLACTRGSVVVTCPGTQVNSSFCQKEKPIGFRTMSSPLVPSDECLCHSPGCSFYGVEPALLSNSSKVPNQRCSFSHNIPELSWVSRMN